MKKELLKTPDYLEPLKAKLNNADFVDVLPVNFEIDTPRKALSISVHTYDDTEEDGLVADPERSKKVGKAIAHLPELIQALQYVYVQESNNLSIRSLQKIEGVLSKLP